MPHSLVNRHLRFVSKLHSLFQHAQKIELDLKPIVDNPPSGWKHSELLYSLV